MDKIVRRSESFAAVAHKNQTYGSYNYVKHLKDVYMVLVRFGYKDTDILTSAWLHDIIEDTNITYQDLKKYFNTNIAEIVYAVTDELGRNRRERKEKTWNKIEGNYKATIIKLADRIANIEFSINHDDKSKLSMYDKEHLEFREKLYYTSTLNLENMWEHLDTILESNK